ncbi:MAG TPA: ORF6N domain-containing protein [Sulfurimonas sp.]|nr:ORF6N domain-containing protein [Sulfurimonas sp.]
MDMEIIKFETLEKKLIKYNNDFVLVDKDVADVYGVTTKEINQAVSNNPDKFPNDYIIELTKKEKNELVKKFDRFNKLKHSTVNPKVFTEKGLYMLATIIKSKVATQTTLKIIETFANVRQLSRNLNAIDEDQTQEEQQALVMKSNELLEKVIEIEPVRELKDDETEVITKIELNLGFVKASRVVKIKKSKEE